MKTVRRKSTVKTGTIVKIVITILLLLVAAAILVRVLRTRVASNYSVGGRDTVLEAQAAIGNIGTTITGSGTLANEESEDTFISANVDVTEIYVSAGDTVKKGDMLASVNSASVAKEMKAVQDKINTLDKQINALKEESIDQKLKSGVAGRVKVIYAEPGMQAADIMYEHKALMLLSADGYMAADIPAGTLVKGDTVTVRTAVADAVACSVSTVWAGTATVLIPDDKAAFGETVSVLLENSAPLTAEAYIHQEVAITGFTGIVSKLLVAVDAKVRAGTQLMVLSDVSSTVNYATLLSQREDLEDQLRDLIVIHQEGAVFAKSKGMITAISETEDSTTTTTAAGTGRYTGSTYTMVTENSSAEDGTTISICPTETMSLTISIDETDILSLEEGQEAAITIAALGTDTYHGTVTAIDMASTSSSGVTAYTATITLDKADGMLSGMTANVVITINGHEHALLLPTAAIQRTRSTFYVYTSYDQETGEYGGMQEISTGLVNATNTEIVSGITEGTTVYYPKPKEDSSTRRNRSGSGNMPGSNGMPSGGNFPGQGNWNGNNRSSGQYNR